MNSRTDAEAKAKAEAEIKARAEALARDPALLFKVKKALDQAIIGEDQSKLLLFLICCTSLGKRPLGAIITGESSAGKSWLVKRVLSYFDNKETFSRLTEASPDRLAKSFDNTILCIEELSGAAKAQSKLRVWISEGQLRLQTTAKDEEGNITTETIVTKGVPVFITTTTSVQPDEELMNRLYSISIDESKEQTKKILMFEAAEFMEPTGLKERYAPDPVIKRMLHIDVLAPFEVLIPFANKIALNFPFESLRARRDYKKFMNILCSVAFLHQKQRPIVHPKGMKLVNYIVALPVDFYMAWLVAEQGLRETLMGLQGRALRTLMLFQPKGSLTVKDVALKLDYSQNRAREILNVLADKGFLDKDESQKTHLFSLPANRGDNPTIKDLMGFSRGFGEKELKKYLNDHQLITRNYTYGTKFVDPLTGENQDITDPNTVNRVIGNKQKELIEGAIQRIDLEKTSENSIVASPSRVKLSLGELIPKLRDAFKKGTEQDFEELAVKIGGLLEEEAESLFNMLMDEGRLAYDKEGWWRWI